MRKRIGILARTLFSERTLLHLRFDWLRFRARLALGRRHSLRPPSPRLHLGCGSRRVEGWLNIDVCQSDFDVDLAAVPLPWENESFECVVSQQVIEHLDLRLELLPLLRDLFRMTRPGAELWLGCPDMEKVCRGYLADRGETLYRDARTRGGIVLPEGMPFQHYINDIFHQDGSHKNLYDFELLSWALHEAGFADCARVEEGDLLGRFPGFPARRDDVQSLYVRARKPAT